MALPSIDEQKRVLANVHRELGEVDIGIGRIKREIILIQEYRTRLTVDAVTGRVDIRHLDLGNWEDCTPDGHAHQEADDRPADEAPEEAQAWDQ